MIAPDWEFNGVVRSPSGYGSSRSLSSLETNDVKTMDLGFMRFKEDEEEESDDINVHGHTKLELGLSRSDSNACEEDESTFKADHGFGRILVTSLTTDSDVNDDQVGKFSLCKIWALCYDFVWFDTELLFIAGWRNGWNN